MDDGMAWLGWGLGDEWETDRERGGGEGRGLRSREEDEGWRRGGEGR